VPRLNFRIHPQLKQRLDTVSERYGLPQAEIVRLVLKVGLPLLEGILEAEQSLIRELLLYQNTKLKVESSFGKE